MYSDRVPILCLLLMFITAADADTAHVTNEIQVGLHTDKTIDSPIAKLLPSGSTLEIVKKEGQMSFVRDSAGATGWLDNTYLLPGQPDSLDITGLQKKNRDLEQQLLAANRKIQEGGKGAAPEPGAETVSKSTAEFEQLQQELNSERIRNGELQVELTELQKRVGKNNDNASLFDKILALEETNKNLRIQLDSLGSGDGTGAVAVISQDSRSESQTNWRSLSIYLAVALLTGLGLGVYLMDYLNRRRHGGYRI